MTPTHRLLALALLPGLAASAVPAAFAAASLAPAPTAAAQASPTRGTIEVPVRVTSPPSLRAEFQPMPGPATGHSGPATGGCPSIVASHTDSTFGPGSYVVQAGFAQNEIAAASFTLPASAFPIILESAEMLFATSSTNVTTTTEWSFLVWEGTPANGMVIEEYNSDGTLLPHIVIPPGTNGVNVMVIVDPQDPEQIVIQGGTTNTFTIGYRIDKHHNQTQNPCFFGPPTTSNAFPTTDVSGLQSPSGNWLFGVNCGSLGCPANGGWATFQQLPSYCTPSGDWVMRATWRSVNCSQTVGACCLPNGSCSIVAEASCISAGGIYQGDNVLCISVECSEISLGACCFGDVCVDGTIQADCVNAGGIYIGNGTNCATVDCNPLGACCFSATGGCLSLTQDNCAAAGGQWNAEGTCETFVCFPSGACCLPDGTCLGGDTGMTPAECGDMGGVFQGDGTSCATFSCPIADGACCFSATGGCLLLSPASCATAGGVFAGGGTTCPDGCAPDCPADLNGDGEVNLTDLLELLSAWGPCPGCPQDLNGDDEVNLADLLDLLSAWGPC